VGQINRTAIIAAATLLPAGVVEPRSTLHDEPKRTRNSESKLTPRKLRSLCRLTNTACSSNISARSFIAACGPRCLLTASSAFNQARGIQGGGTRTGRPLPQYAIVPPFTRTLRQCGDSDS